MEIIKTDLKKYLGKTITIMFHDGSHERIRVEGVKELGGKQTILGRNDEGQNAEIKSTDMAMIYPVNGVM